MTSFQVHTIETAPEASRPVLEATRKAWGFVPTLQGTLAESPVALQAYTTRADRTVDPDPHRAAGRLSGGERTARLRVLRGGAYLSGA